MPEEGEGNGLFCIVEADVKSVAAFRASVIVKVYAATRIDEEFGPLPGAVAIAVYIAVLAHVTPISPHSIGIIYPYRPNKGTALCMEKKGKKLYMVGIDSAPLWLIKELTENGIAAGFSRFLKNGSISEMESTLPPMTGAAWPSIYTGLPPGEHGVPDFFEIKGDYSQQLIFYDPRQNPPFWELLAESGLRCLVITPATDTKLSDNGNIDMITGFPLKPKSSPSISSVVEKHDFSGEPDVEKMIKSRDISIAQAAGILADSARRRAAISRELLESGSYDFVFVCFTETDRIQHFALSDPHRRTLVYSVYREISDFINYLIGISDKEGGSLLLVSDHGAQPIANKFLINSYLEKHSYISLPERQKGNANGSRLHHLDFDMARTKAFAALSYGAVCSIWINDKRFESCAVTEEERPSVKAELMDLLRAARSAEGDKVFCEVIDAKDYYLGTTKFIAPDIFVQAKEGYVIDIFSFSDSNFLKPEDSKSGDHTRHGIIGIHPSGSAVMPSNPCVLDVAPAVLDYFGIGRRDHGTDQT